MTGEPGRPGRPNNPLKPQKPQTAAQRKKQVQNAAPQGNGAPPSPGQAEVNLIALRMKIEEDKKHAARARAFKVAEDRKWAIIKDERIRKRRAKEEYLREARRKG
jgi:hypothetical protein